MQAYALVSGIVPENVRIEQRCDMFMCVSIPEAGAKPTNDKFWSSGMYKFMG